MDVIVGARYRHYSEKEYIVIGVCHHSETLEKLVIYQGQYDDSKFGPDPLWARPDSMFIEEVEIDGVA